MKSRLTLYFVLLIGSIVLISCFGGTVSYALFFAMLLIPVLSYGYLLTVLAGFKIYQKIDSRDVVTHVPMGYYFILKNDGFVSFSSIQIRMFSSFSDIEELPSDSEFCLLPGEEYRFDTRIFCKYRGEYEVGIKEIILTDFLKLFKLKYRLPSTIKAIVMPTVICVDSLRGFDEANSLSAKETAYGDGMDVVVRDYVTGDSLRRISWKATARENHLMTRVALGEEKQGIAIVLDQRRYSKNIYEYLPTEDRLLGAFLATAMYLIGKEVPVDIVNENSAERIETKASFNSFYSGLEHYHFQENYVLERVLETNVARLSQYKIVMLFVQEMTEAELIRVKHLSDNGTYVMIYVMGDCEKESEYVRMLGNNSFRGKVISVRLDTSIEEVLS